MMLDLLGIPSTCTDKEVEGEVVQVLVGNPGSFELNCKSLLTISPQLYVDIIFPNGTVAAPERVLIARRGARSLINEDEVEGLLRERGFVRCYFEELPLSHQWSIARNARCVVAIHGAALSSLAFRGRSDPNGSTRAAPPLKLVELFSAAYVV